MFIIFSSLPVCFPHQFLLRDCSSLDHQPLHLPQRTKESLFVKTLHDMLKVARAYFACIDLIWVDMVQVVVFEFHIRIDACVNWSATRCTSQEDYSQFGFLYHQRATPLPVEDDERAATLWCTLRHNRSGWELLWIPWVASSEFAHLLLLMAVAFQLVSLRSLLVPAKLARLSLAKPWWPFSTRFLALHRKALQACLCRSQVLQRVKGLTLSYYQNDYCSWLGFTRGHQSVHWHLNSLATRHRELVTWWFHYRISYSSL